MVKPTLLRAHRTILQTDIVKRFIVAALSDEAVRIGSGFRCELRLHQAAEPMGLGELTEGGEYRSEQPPPSWAFAWKDGQGRAQFLLAWRVVSRPH